MDTAQVLDVVGSLISQLKAYSTKLPEVVSMAAVPGGLKPSPEVVETYEKTISRFRDHAAGTKYQRLSESFVETLEAFESGWMLRAVQALLMGLDQLELMKREQAITVTPAEQARLDEYRRTLHKILPGNKPELEGAGKWM